MLIALIIITLISTSLSIPPYDPPYYNIIDVTPKCYTMGLCTEYGAWGKSIYSVHPSSEERTLHLLRNMVRLFPTQYRNSKYGVREWGYKGSDSWTYDTEGYCNQAAEYPTYWYSMGTQAARFHQWDKFTCDTFIGHESCSNPDRCTRFGSCSFSDRSRTFVPGRMYHSYLVCMYFWSLTTFDLVYSSKQKLKTIFVSLKTQISFVQTF